MERYLASLPWVNQTIDFLKFVEIHRVSFIIFKHPVRHAHKYKASQIRIIPGFMPVIAFLDLFAFNYITIIFQVSRFLTGPIQITQTDFHTLKVVGNSSWQDLSVKDKGKEFVDFLCELFVGFGQGFEVGVIHKADVEVGKMADDWELTVADYF